MSKASARIALREGTSEHHRRVDTVYSQAVLDDRASYMRFLLAQASAHVPTEQALERGGIAAIVPDWPARQRAAQLKADLAALGHELPPVDPFILEGEPALLGALYVLEGSRLGGTVLKRSLPSDFPAAFLGGVNSGAWRSLLELLDTRLVEDHEIRDAVVAAVQVFTLFETAGRKYFDVS